jgi:hypothetical protein
MRCSKCGRKAAEVVAVARPREPPALRAYVHRPFTAPDELEPIVVKSQN